MKKMIRVAVDGTAGSGKSTIMKLVSEKLNITFFDTGLMYRAFTLFCLKNNIDFKNSDIMEGLLHSFNFELNDSSEPIINGENYDKLLTSYDVVKNIKYVANNIKVREFMVNSQRKIAFNKSIIMVGRDITTVVLPNADLKIYFDCSIEARAKRRFEQNNQNNIIPNNYEEIYNSIYKRDENDKNRSIGALKVADSAWVFDTSFLTINEAVEKVIEKVKSIE
ncbi:cytidylate kinase [Spiroplasma corruscae]|uniref:Cytidylate kinase n=1 Tax=Spiroplasma corruscae TaxID=216934 RepID=A0A222EQQ4_9MOLU|nr:(d)CMP kinase [Spiroplasma corruscae]ASP28573.1 cytidylate kinase [Spiroplasma corruscae]